MGNNQSYKFKDLEITSTRKAQNMGLLAETNSSGTIYIVDSVSRDNIYKTVNKCLSWTLINDGVDHYPTGMWHDRDNGILRVVYSYPGTSRRLRYKTIDLSNDSVTTVSTTDVDAGNFLQPFDVFMVGSKVYALCRYIEWTAVDSIYIYDITNDPAVLIDSLVYDNIANTPSWVVVVGTDVYFYFFKTANNSHLFKFDENAGTLSHLKDCGVNTDSPVQALRAIAYDGSDLLYFVLDVSGTNYLYTYSISTTTLTQLSEYNICLMLDRNCSNKVPNEFEKAFDTTRNGTTNLSRIWEIKPVKGGLIQLQTIYKTQNIIAITDNYLMFANGAMYEYTDLMIKQTIAEGVLTTGIFPIPTTGRFNCHPDDAILFYNDDSLKVYDDTNVMILFAKITDKSQDENGIYQFGLDAYTNELWRRSYVKTHTTTNTGEKQQDNIDNNCSFCRRDSSIVATTTDYSYEQDRPPMAIFDMGRILERQVGYSEPDGLVWTKAYNGLAKAPQYYPSSYPFREDTIGSAPSGWVDGSGGSCTISVKDSLDGHKKVLKLYDPDGAALAKATHSITQQADQTLEFYIAKNSIAANTHLVIIFFEGANTRIRLLLSEDDLRYYDSGSVLQDVYMNWNVANTMVRIKIILDDTANTFDIYVNGTIRGNDLEYETNSVTSPDTITIQTNTADLAYSCFFDALGITSDSGYNVGDNKVAWDVEINGNVDLINIDDKPSYYPKKLGITRATCVGAAGISQTYSVATLEGGKAIIPLKEYRDLKIQADTEALQIATALFNTFSKETKFIGLRVVNQEFIQAGKTVNFANTGDITITESDYLVLYYEYDFIGDVYELMILTDNILLLKEIESYFDRSPIMVHQNSTAVRENQVSINTKPTFHTGAGNPTVNEDTDLGYEKGDLWLNTTDKGLFVCCDNADGAADWDEITKA